MAKQVDFGIDGFESADVIPSVSSASFQTPNVKKKGYLQQRENNAWTTPGRNPEDEIPTEISPASICVNTPWLKGSGSVIRERVNVFPEFQGHKRCLERVLIAWLRNYILARRLGALHLQCAEGNVENVGAQLHQHGDQIKYILFKQHRHGHVSSRSSAFHIAVLHSQLSVLQLLNPQANDVLARMTGNGINGLNLLHFAAQSNSSLDVIQYLTDCVSVFGLPPGQRLLCQPSTNDTVLSGPLMTKMNRSGKYSFGFVRPKLERLWVTVTNTGLFLRKDEHSRSFLDFFPLLPGKAFAKLQRIMSGYSLHIHLRGGVTSTIRNSKKLTFHIRDKFTARLWLGAVATVANSQNVETLRDDVVGKVVYVDQQRCALTATTLTGQNMGHLLAVWAAEHPDAVGTVEASLEAKFLWLYQHGVSMKALDDSNCDVVDTLLSSASNGPLERSRLNLLGTFVHQLDSLALGFTVAKKGSKAHSSAVVASTSPGASPNASGKGSSIGERSPSRKQSESGINLNSAFAEDGVREEDEQSHHHLNASMNAWSGFDHQLHVDRVVGTCHLNYMLGYSYCAIHFKSIRIDAGGSTTRQLQLEVTVFSDLNRRSILKTSEALSPGAVSVSAEKFTCPIWPMFAIASSSCDAGPRSLGLTYAMCLPLESPLLSAASPVLVRIVDLADHTFLRWSVIGLSDLVSSKEVLRLPLFEDSYFKHCLASYVSIMHGSSADALIAASDDYLLVETCACRLSGLLEHVSEDWFTNRSGRYGTGHATQKLDERIIQARAAVRSLGARHINIRVENHLNEHAKAFSDCDVGMRPLNGKGKGGRGDVVLKTLEYVDGEPAEVFYLSVAQLRPLIEASGGKDLIMYRFGGRQDRSLHVPANLFDAILREREKDETTDKEIEAKVIVIANI